MSNLSANSTQNEWCLSIPVGIEGIESQVFAVNIISIILNIPMVCIAFISNIIIIVAVWRGKSSLRKAYHLLLVSQAATDVLVGGVLQTIFIARRLILLVDDGTTLCWLYVLYISFGWFLACCSLLTLTAISIDRYISICYALRHRQLVTTEKVMTAIVIIWFCSLLPATSIFYFSYRSAVRFASSVVVFCVAVCSYAYLRMYFTVRQQNAQVSDMNHSNYTRTNQKRERSVAKNLGIVIAVIYLCYTPAFLAYFSNALRGPSPFMTYLVFPLTDTIAMINSSINPFLYCQRNADIRQAVKGILGYRVGSMMLFLGHTKLEPFSSVGASRGVRNPSESNSVEGKLATQNSLHIC